MREERRREGREEGKIWNKFLTAGMKEKTFHIPCTLKINETDNLKQ
jgi:hypothetical protein